MAHAALHDLAADVRRLLMAGAPTAGADAGLRARHSALAAPGLAPLAGLVTRLLGAGPADAEGTRSEAAPLALTLAHACAQLEGARAELAAVPAAARPLPSAARLGTPLPAHEAQALQDALGDPEDAKGRKRVKEAVAAQRLVDLRLSDAWLGAWVPYQFAKHVEDFTKACPDEALDTLLWHLAVEIRGRRLPSPPHPSYPFFEAWDKLWHERLARDPARAAALARQLLPHSWIVTVIIPCVQAMQAAPQPEDGELLLALLARPDIDYSSAGVVAAGLTPTAVLPAEAVRRLLDLVPSKEPHFGVVCALKQFPEAARADARALPYLHATLDLGPNDQFRYMASDALLALGTPKALAVVAAHLDSAATSIVYNAVKAALRLPEAFERLAPYFEFFHGRLRNIAITATACDELPEIAGERDDPRWRARLVALANDPRVWADQSYVYAPHSGMGVQHCVATVACATLGRLPSPETRATLVALLARGDLAPKHPGFFVAKVLADALRQEPDPATTAALAAWHQGHQAALYPYQAKELKDALKALGA